MSGKNGGRRTAKRLRVAIFTHDTFGLGHVRRSLHILRSLARADGEAALMLVTGSPAVHALADLPPNADFVKVPTIAKTGSRANRPPHLPIAQPELARIRREIIRETLVSFAPDVLLIDNFPLGSQYELLETVHQLRDRSTRIVLGLRDVLDSPDVIQSDWGRQGMYEILDRYFDRILVFGMREVLDVFTAYALPASLADRVRYCGYVAEPAAGRRDRDVVRAEVDLPGPLAVVTGGGGGDAFPLLKLSLEALQRLPDVSAFVITGPLMRPAEREKLRAQVGGRSNVVVRDFVPDVPSYLGAADVVISMCGYNTAAEIASTQAPALVVPRTWRYGEYLNRARSGAEWEQLLRAQALSRLGFVRMIDPEAASAEGLAAGIREALDTAWVVPPMPIDLGGIENATKEILELAGGAG